MFLRLRFPFISSLLFGAAISSTSCIRIPASLESKPVSLQSKKIPVRTEAVSSNPGKDPDVLVWMIADNLHTGMVFPYDWLIESGLRPPPDFPKAKYVSMSWGNRQAYVQRAWLTPWQAFRALCTPSPSVMEMIPFDSDVVPVCHTHRIWKKLVPREQGVYLAAFLNNCVRQQANGPLVIAPSSWGEGVLMESPWRYYIPRVCNIWTAQTIEACGGDMHLWGTMTAGGIIRQAERNGFQKIWDGYPTE